MNYIRWITALRSRRGGSEEEQMMQELYLVCDRNSSAQDGVVLDVVYQEAGVVKHLDDVADLTHLEEREDHS